MVQRRGMRPSVEAIAAALGIAACHTPGPTTDGASPVRAREIAPLADAPAEQPATDASSAAAAPAPSASASASDAVAPVAAAVPAAAGAVPLGLFVRRALGAPQSTPPAAPGPSAVGKPAAPGPGRGLSVADIGTTHPDARGSANCGGQVSPKMSSPTVTVELGIAPRQGLDDADARQASTALGLLRNQVRVCVQKGLAMDPTIPSALLAIAMKSPGGGLEATVAPPSHPVALASAEKCIERVLITKLGGDAAPASLVFALRIAIRGQ